MSKMPPTCTDCLDADATHPDGWCDECAAMRDDDPVSPNTGRPRHGWALEAIRAIYAPPSVPFPAPGTVEPRYRFPF